MFSQQSMPLLLHIQPSPIHPQPFLSFAIIGNNLIHLIPKSIGMVQVMEMAELVHHNVVDDCLRCHHALPMEGKVAVR